MPNTLESGEMQDRRNISRFRERVASLRPLTVWMARMARVLVPELAHHVTQRGNNLRFGAADRSAGQGRSRPPRLGSLQIRCKWGMEIGRIWWQLVGVGPSEKCSGR